MATGYLLPISALYQGFSDQGIVGAGYKINTYVGGSVSTPVTTYTDSTLTTPNANPIILGSNGRFQSLNVWVPAGTSVKLVLTDNNNNVLTGGTIDNVTGVNDLSSLTGSQVGAALYPQTAAETTASVTPTYLYYPPLDVRRYGAALNAAWVGTIGTAATGTDDTAAFQAAINVAGVAGGEVIFTGPTIVKNLAMASNVTLRGVGNPTMYLNATSTTDFAIKATGTLGSAATLSSSAGPGTTNNVANVTSGTVANLAVGNWVLVNDTQVTSTVAFNQEITKVYGISGTAVTLRDTLMGSYLVANSGQVSVLNAVSNIKLRDFLVVNTASLKGGGISFQYVADFELTGVKVYNFWYLGAVSLNSCAYGRITSCRFADGQDLATPGTGHGGAGGTVGFPLQIWNATHHVIIDGNDFENYCQNIVTLRCRFIEFTNNTCRNATDSAINTHGSLNSDILINDNLIDGCLQYGVAVGQGSAVAWDSNVTVARNRIKNCGYYGISSSYNVASGVNSNLVFEDNDILNVGLVAAGYGLYLTGSTDVVAKGNRVNGATQGVANSAGISFANITRLLAVNNLVENVTSGYGIQLSTCSGYELAGNYLYNNGSYNVLTATSSGTNRVHDNYASTTTNSIETGVAQWGNSWQVGLPINGLRGAQAFSAATSQAVAFGVTLPAAPTAVTLTASATSTSPPWVTGITTTGFTINFSAAFTGTVYWSAQQ